RYPGGEGFPSGPLQVIGYIAWPDRIAAVVVDGAAVDGPELAADVFDGRHRRLEQAVDPIEIERRPHPGNRRNDVKPSQSQVQPLGYVRFYQSFLNPVPVGMYSVRLVMGGACGRASQSASNAPATNRPRCSTASRTASPATMWLMVSPRLTTRSAHAPTCRPWPAPRPISWAGVRVTMSKAWAPASCSRWAASSVQR